MQLSVFSYGHGTHTFLETKFFSSLLNEDSEEILSLCSYIKQSYLSGKNAPVFIANYLNTNRENWETYFSNDQIEIQYKYSECDDVQNDKYFSYYLIKVKNKTNSTIIVNYILGENEGDQEKFKEMSLQPNGEIKGSCNSNDSRLRIFVNDRKNNAKPQKHPFMISKIKSYEI